MKELNFGLIHLSQEIKHRYFAGLNDGGSTLEDSINWDEDYLTAEFKSGRIRKDRLTTFLLGGCSWTQSLGIMRQFVGQYGGRQSKLIVAELDAMVLGYLKTDLGVTLDTNTKLIQSDLLRPPIKPGSVDYIRLDMLQSFIPPESQLELLTSLKRILSSHGRISSVIEMVSETANKKIGYEFKNKDFSGSRIIPADHGLPGLKYFCFSRQYFNQVCSEAGLVYSFRNNKEMRGVKGRVVDFQHVVMQKK